MAKDKNFEKEYKTERLRRNHIRRKNRKEQYDNKIYAKKNGWCPDCGGQMTWCESCRMWSAYCCEEYGTCMCS